MPPSSTSATAHAPARTGKDTTRCVRLALFLGLIAAGAPAVARETAPRAPDRSAHEDSVTITYLGAGGVSIRRGAEHVLTAPFFSNPGLWSVLFRRIRPAEDRFPPGLAALTADVQAVFVGHAHYDHLLDLPRVAGGLPDSAIIYGSNTTAHILAAARLPVRVEGLNARAGDATRTGEWIAVGSGRVRFMALRSGHAPHFLGLRVFDGVYTEDLTELPRRARGWKIGLPLSFVIDFMDRTGETPRFRIFYQDAATSPGVGFPPDLGDGKAFDLAILCVAGFGKAKNHPEAIVRALQPAAVVGIHWEDFFRPLTPPLRPVTGSNARKFITRLERVLPDGSRSWLPDPGTRLTLPYSGEPSTTRGAETRATSDVTSR